MDFSFLYDRQRALFAIGYQLTTHPRWLTTTCWRRRRAWRASWPSPRGRTVEHWFHLGRELSRAAGWTALMSWSGTMFST